MDKLKSYKLDCAFTDGVCIRLDNAPDVEFMVRLPSQYNRAYTQALYGALDWSLNDEGDIKPGGNVLDTRFHQIDAFIGHCLLSVDGEPAPDNFSTEYPGAVDELMIKANELANAISERVDDSVGKSSGSASGDHDGLDGRSFMPPLSNAAS